ncbi:uncharacterized protein LOC6553874 [Drosophila erecta]|uniref:GG17165 n=1 Tax=Drosophila erecta TaxID=7220 RepID=B3P1H2_DROER|nr:uncharacterized protein LOC6553874 [Drosophila erecta]EDV49431.1 uncharacterized protein Dere_GG17165 [Drosophila erecta]
MSILKEVCGGPEPKWKSDESIHKLPEAKLISSLECIQLKRELESESQDEFEVSPMILCLMLTFLLFLIGFWIWLISRSCLFSQPEQVEKNTMDKGRISGGSTPRYRSHKIRCFDEVADWDGNPLNYSGSKQGILKASYCHLMDLNRKSPVSVSPGLETEYESSHKGTESLPRTDEKETDISTSQALAGSPLSFCSPKRKYRIKWSKFIRRNRKNQSETESPQ